MYSGEQMVDNAMRNGSTDRDVRLRPTQQSIATLRAKDTATQQTPMP